MGNETRGMVPVKNDGILPIYSGTIGNEEVNAVDARALHEKLQVQTRFDDWMRRRIIDCDLEEGEDFVSLLKNEEREIGATRRKEYWLTLDSAKEISMIEKNGHGKRIRRYFIDAEKELRLSRRTGYQIPQTFSEALLLAANKQQQLEIQAPKVEAFEAFIDTEGSFSIGATARLMYDKGGIGIGEKRLFAYLRGKGILMKDNRPYQRYMNQGLFEVKAIPIGHGKTVVQPRATAKGVDYIFQLLKKEE